MAILKGVINVRKIFILWLVLVGQGFSARIKDIAQIEGARENYLVGFGIVVGLQGTGDSLSPVITVQSIINMLQRMGIRPDPVSMRNFGLVLPRHLRPRDAASVMVTAKLPPFARQGMKIDVNVSALSDAKSLRGGNLVMTPLFGPDGKVWAIAQGQVITGGNMVGASPIRLRKGFPTSGRVPKGAIVEHSLPVEINAKETVNIILDTADFTTAKAVADIINSATQAPIAIVVDQRTVSILVPLEYRGRVAEFIAILENLEIFPDAPARVVVDERTGTVVMGENVRISEVAVSHGDLQVVIKKEPSPLRPWETAIETEKIHIMEVSTTVGDLVRALNKIGASPRDVISILQAIKRAGALHAHLETM